APEHSHSRDRPPEPRCHLATRKRLRYIAPTRAKQMSTETQPKKDDKNTYKGTLNLPQTNFAMEAKLVQSEPARLAKWQGLELYKMLMRQRAGGPQWILHDGPPFAHGDIHICPLINKT